MKTAKRFTCEAETYKIGDLLNTNPPTRITNITLMTRPDNTGEVVIHTLDGQKMVTPFIVDVNAIKRA